MVGQPLNRHSLSAVWCLSLQSSTDSIKSLIDRPLPLLHHPSLIGAYRWFITVLKNISASNYLLMTCEYCYIYLLFTNLFFVTFNSMRADAYTNMHWKQSYIKIEKSSHWLRASVCGIIDPRGLCCLRRWYDVEPTWIEAETILETCRYTVWIAYPAFSFRIWTTMFRINYYLTIVYRKLWLRQFLATLDRKHPFSLILEISTVMPWHLSCLSICVLFTHFLILIIMCHFYQTGLHK